MKIGDKVRFLSETGGGRIAGFQGNKIVLVEDEDGFQIPTDIHDVVVVEQDNYTTGKMVATKMDAQPQEEEPEITFKAPVQERDGGNKLSAYLAFVPIDIKEVTNTRFETYFINDSNYYLHYTYLFAEGNAWTLKSEGEVEPNTKAFIEEFGREVLNNMEHIAIQLIAYKKEKPFLLKPAVDVQFRLDPVKFYKLHVFQENVFFDTPALLYTIIEYDEVARPLVIDSKRLKEQMYKEEKIVVPPQKKREKEDGTIVIDLHADVLLETTVGMNSADILHYQVDEFKKVMMENRKKKGQKIVFIHGKGEGVLRHAIIHELSYRFKPCTYQDASFQEYGYGATQVTIK